MTCIVGITNGSSVYIGGDRSASDGDAIVSMCRPKVHVRGDWIFGYAGNIGKGQLLEFITLPIVEDNDDPYCLLRLDVVETLREAINTYSDNESDHTDWLIGCKGRLFEISSDGWGVVEVKESSIGSGSTYALGSLHATQDLLDVYMYRIDMALNAAITYSPTCQGPVDILSL